MTEEKCKIFAALKEAKLPEGWICELAWPWREDTHLVAPGRKGGVVVKDRWVFVQLPGDGTCSKTVDIGHEYTGRGWLARLVDDAVKAAHEYAVVFKMARK